MEVATEGIAAVDPIAVFGVAGFTILLLMTACAVLWRRLVQVQDMRDAERAQQVLVAERMSEALSAANELVRDVVRTSGQGGRGQ